MKVRRPRAARACDLCRVKKNKCDELYPCTYCKDRNAECLTSKHRYVRHLEDLVRQLTASQGQQPHEGMFINQDRPTPQPDRSPNEAGLLPGASMPRSALDNPSTTSAASRQGAGHEVSGVNRHTQNVEFYGRSSSVALLSQVQRSGEESAIPEEGELDAGVILSNLHNPAFSPADAQNNGHEGPSLVTPSHYPQCRSFLDGFFGTIHFIHPIIDKGAFLRRCELLWSGAAEATQHSSFTALYYSILSLGALVGPRDDEPIDGTPNIQWSRKFFDEARFRCNKLGMVTDLEMVQCYFFMAKVCQNELNAHWSYMYIGLAVRTALAMGINREPPSDTKKDPAQLRAECRTWWGLYSLETEISFAMGRPDTLGADSYHNRRFPRVRDSEIANTPDTESLDLGDPPYCGIIEPMVEFARITKRVCLAIYLQDNTTPRTIAVANQIERELDEWVERVPPSFRPQIKDPTQPETLKSAKEPKWAKRQRLVLLIRYFNLKILLFGSILLTSTAAERASLPSSTVSIQKCLEAAKQTIQVIYQVYQHHDFFHTWFYNTTYTVFAASIILVYVAQEATESEIQPLLKLVSMAIEILETMDECVVAAKAAQLLRRASENAQKKSISASTSAGANTAAPHPGGQPLAQGHEAMLHLNQYWGPLSFVGGDMDLDFNFFQLADLDGGNPLLMSFGEPADL
ncbi:hypothetical protein N657DRAFT_581552 [Parathielavia appendiculata]|uniref:Zn(2)-C6 fungal-type domain-containing protein n=1 Tax=Parathielavia appendiculata TaxID=2587402 RepID=A0AAN6TS64_9PEZI|nr:hypothetical protein N657DRAFT_581552 [Parathielavia appendiculata]